MPERTFTVDLPVPVAALAGWHATAGLDRLLPPWMPARILSRTGGLTDGTVELSVPTPVPGLRRRWLARNGPLTLDGQVVDGFVDVQEAGPFAAWRHEHRFLAGPVGSRLEDQVTWRAPGGALGRWLLDGWVGRDLDRMFAWRHARTRWDLVRLAEGPSPMTVAISGANGLVGRRLSAFLRGGGHRVVPIVRGASRPGAIAYDPAAGTIDQTALNSVDAIVHLAGANVGQRWTPAAKDEILRSRVVTTGLLARAVAAMPRPPRAFVVASGVGWHGDTGDALVGEGDPAGGGFLAEVCRQWEAAADPARAAGVRTVHMRIGMVLAAEGGALATMAPAFRWGAGGPVGSGRQWIAWIGADDLIDLLFRATWDAGWAGPINAVAPQLLMQRDFAAALGACLHRPAILPLPAPAVRVLFGEMGTGILLASTRVEPRRLAAAGFAWRHPDVAVALRAELG
jgi:uncharacterized protein (TIGR01777 family)